MDVAHHRLRRSVTPRTRRTRLAGGNQIAAAKLDRKKRRRGNRFQDRQTRTKNTRVYNAAGHAVWRNVPGARAGTSTYRSHRDRGAVAGDPRISREDRTQKRARTSGTYEGKDRRFY